MRQYFENVFGELLSLIQDQDIRNKTVDAWVLAAEQGGWTKPEELEKMPFTLLTDCRGINLIEHTIAVTKGAIGLANSITSTYAVPWWNMNMDFVVAGGLLHDVGKLDEFELVDGEYRKSLAGKCARHPISGATIASKVDLPLEIINIIACHAKEGEGRPQRVETVMIHQADFATFNPMVMLKGGTLIV
ncbi:MAG: HDIG domain-containing protein [Bacteroidetes bacterium]|nr:HDIG domain-containing protein [Bacteroidota bacterium]MBU1717463.1 HDIG domain-containing protein [Bacteroidota bacterium]